MSRRHSTPEERSQPVHELKHKMQYRFNMLGWVVPTPEIDIASDASTEEVWVIEVPADYPHVLEGTEYVPDGLLHWNDDSGRFYAKTLDECLGFVKSFANLAIEGADSVFVNWSKLMRIRNVATGELIAGAILL